MLNRLLIYTGLSAVFTLILTLTAHAQNEPIKFGKLDLKEVQSLDFAADSGAEAVVLCDFGRSHIAYIQNDFQVVFERVTRIKILKKSGYDLAKVEVPLYQKERQKETLSNLRGITYNVVKGQLVKEKMESSAVFTEQQDVNHSLRKFTLPNVHEGSIIEYAYTVNSDFLFNFQDWQFQQSIPVRWSEYRASIPEYFDYRLSMQGYEPLVVSEQNTSSTLFTIYSAAQSSAASISTGAGRTGPSTETLTARTTNYRWALENAPAFRTEPFMTTTRDYIARVDFELKGTQFPQSAYQNLVGTWSKVNISLLDDDAFGAQIGRTGFLKAEVAAIVAKFPEPLARAAAIQELVKANLKHNGDDRLYSKIGVRKAYEQHTGNSAEVNLLFIGLLRNAGLTVTPVILSTREHGRLDVNLPMVSRFNYVLGSISLPDNKQLLVDATEPYAELGMLPERCLNTQGHYVTQENLEDHWVTVTSPQRYVHFQTAQLTLDDHGALKGKLHEEHAGYQAIDARTELSKLGEKKYIEENYLKAHEGWSIPKYTVQQATTISKPLALDMEVEIAGENDAAGTIYLAPMRYFGETANPFRLVDRRFPVDFGAAREETLMLTYALPAGYEVEELPKSMLISLPDNGGRFQYSVTPGPLGLQVVSRLLFAKASYSAEEYASLREFYNYVVAKHAERIVLKKKS